MTTLPRKAKMADLINYRLRVVLVDDTQEFRATKKSLQAVKIAKSSGSDDLPSIREERRSLGLVILRGEHVISVSVESRPSNTDPAARLSGAVPSTSGSTSSGIVAQGFARPINRPAGNALQGPARTSAAAFFGGGPAAGNAPPGFRPPPGFGGR